MKLSVLAVAATAFTFWLVSAPAAATESQQYYGEWHEAPSHSYQYRTYYYKPKPKYQGYHHHYVIHYPSQPYYYYYNPYTKKVWGRCSMPSGDAEMTYSKLPPEKQAARIKDVPEDAFPKPGSFPAIPESNGSAQMDAPPDDLPPNDLPAE